MRSLARTWRSVEMMAWSSLRRARVSLWAKDVLDGGCEAAEPSRGGCSSLPRIDFATGVAFTCWMGAEQVYQPDFRATCLGSLLSCLGSLLYLWI